jgi:hypothetical protein
MKKKELQNKLKTNLPFLIKKFTKLNIFNWKDLEHLINFRPILTERNFIATKGFPAQWSYRDWLSDINSFPADVMKQELLTGTCYFKDMSRYNKKINQLVKYFSEQSDCPTDAHIYFSLVVKEEDGFGIHCDESHNFIIQMQGESKVKIWNVTIQNNKKNLENISDKPVIDTVLYPGDLVYVPVWHYHKLTSNTKRISISFPCNPKSKGIKSAFQEREWIEVNKL